MNNRIIFVFFATIVLIMSLRSASTAAAYEASTLHNAVARSETVLDLFFERWSRIQEMDLYVDWYAKLNWVNGFEINSINSGSGKSEAVDMRLVRAYGSITVNIPILGGYDGADMQKRLRYGTGKHSDPESSDGTLTDEGGWIKPKNLILGFTATGFHYGLTREGTIDRGSAGEESFTDYKYTQFFDDIFAMSLLYRPYFNIHLGLVLSQQFEPRDDGTMSYSDPTERRKRFFVSSNLLSFLNLNATSRANELESIGVGVTINPLIGLLDKNLMRGIPQLTITYKQLNLFNDELYDPVWVHSAFQSDGTTRKSDLTPDSEKDSARLHTISMGVKGFVGNWVFVDFLAEMQKPGEKLVSRLNDSRVNYNYLREVRGLVGYNFLGNHIDKGVLFVTSIGMSRYWDPAIPIHRYSGNDYHVYGGLFKIEGRAFLWSIPVGFDLTVTKNYSTELRKMVETVDKWVYEGSLNTSF